MKLYRIKKSKIDNKGKGLYATKDIKKGTKIIDYKGRIISNKQVDESDKYDNGKPIYLFTLNKKFKNSTHLCETVLEETGVAMLPASDFGFNSKRLLTRLCYIDFDGNEFLKADINGKLLSDKIIEKYAPNVVEGVQKLSNWAKNL